MIVEAGSVEATAAALRTLAIESESLANARRAARARACQFEWRTTVNKLIEVTALHTGGKQ
jgi:hypothetical protein